MSGKRRKGTRSKNEACCNLLGGAWGEEPGEEAFFTDKPEKATNYFEESKSVLT